MLADPALVLTRNSKKQSGVWWRLRSLVVSCTVQAAAEMRA
jgi:hypothetical protein